LLLVFFIATSSFGVVEKLMPSGVSEMRPPRDKQQDPVADVGMQNLDQIVVKLSQDGQVTTVILNGATLSSFDQLDQRLKAISAASPAVPVIIDPAPSVPAGQVVRAYDWARSAGLISVYLATRSAHATRSGK
jgi:biopolymer transport protein ExbD